MPSKLDFDARIHLKMVTKWVSWIYPAKRNERQHVRQGCHNKSLDYVWDFYFSDGLKTFIKLSSLLNS